VADIEGHYVAENLQTAEMVADLLTDTPYATNPVRRRKTQINSLLKFCRSRNVSLARALSKEIDPELARNHSA
jgi:hypothetical protein